MLNIIFAGTPTIACPSLKALIESVHTVCAVFTQPDKPVGRGQKISETPVKQLAQQHQITVYQPSTLRDPAVEQLITQLNPDLMVVIAYGKIIPDNILAIPKLGCVNIHFSLLPRWRGAAPIAHSLLHGDKETGVTLMQMDSGLDTGPLFMQQSCKIEANDTSESLSDKLSKLGAHCLIESMPMFVSGKLITTAQKDEHATYAPKLTKEQGQIHWQKSATEIANQIRACNPWPVAYAVLDEQPIRIWTAQALPENPEQLNGVQPQPGQIIASHKAGIDISTGNGILRLNRIQMPNKPVMDVDQIYHSNKWLPGNCLK